MEYKNNVCIVCDYRKAFYNEETKKYSKYCDFCYQKNKLVCDKCKKGHHHVDSKGTRYALCSRCHEAKQKKYIDHLNRDSKCKIETCHRTVTLCDKNGYLFPGCSPNHSSMYISTLPKCRTPGCSGDCYFKPGPRVHSHNCKKCDNHGKYGKYGNYDKHSKNY